MDFNAEHAGYVVAAYGISLAVIAALIIWVIGRDRALRKRIGKHDSDQR